MNHPVQIMFVLKNDEKTQEQADQLQKKNSLAVKAEDANLNLRYRFDTFVVGANNRFAQSACVAVAESPERFTTLSSYMEERDSARRT